MRARQKHRDNRRDGIVSDILTEDQALEFRKVMDEYTSIDKNHSSRVHELMERLDKLPPSHYRIEGVGILTQFELFPPTILPPTPITPEFWARRGKVTLYRAADMKGMAGHSWTDDIRLAIRYSSERFNRIMTRLENAQFHEAKKFIVAYGSSKFIKLSIGEQQRLLAENIHPEGGIFRTVVDEESARTAGFRAIRTISDSDSDENEWIFTHPTELKIDTYLPWRRGKDSKRWIHLCPSHGGDREQYASWCEECQHALKLDEECEEWAA